MCRGLGRLLVLFFRHLLVDGDGLVLDFFALGAGLDFLVDLDDLLADEAFLLGLDLLDADYVDVPAGQLRGEPRVLAALADGERELVVVDNDADALVLLVDLHVLDVGRAERFLDVAARLGLPADDVDLLAAELADDVLDTRAAHAHARADGVDPVVGRHDGDLGPMARLAREALDHNGALGDLGDLEAEELDDQLFGRARQDDLRAARALAHSNDHSADAAADRVALAVDLLLERQDGFGPADLDDEGAVAVAADDARGERADLVGELAEDDVLLSLAQFLDDDLARGLRSDAAEVLGGDLHLHHVADLDGLVLRARLAEVDLLEPVGAGLDDAQVGEHLDLGRVGVDAHAEVVAGAEALLRGGDEGRLDRGDDRRTRDALLTLDILEDLK